MEIAVWAEKYRPSKLSEVINQKHVVERLKAFVKDKNIPHMLFAGPAGTGKCVEKSTPIPLSNGNIVPISDVKIGDRVLSLDKNGSIEPKTVLNVINRSDKTFRFKTRLGNEIEVTKEHPFLTLDNGTPKWKETSEIHTGDFIAAPLEIPVNSTMPKKIEFNSLNGFWGLIKQKKKIKTYELFEGNIKDVLYEFFKKNKLSKHDFHLGIKRQTLEWCLRKLTKKGILKRTKHNYQIVKKYTTTNIVPIRLAITSQVEKISYKGKYSHFSIWIKPFDPSPSFYEWLGYILAEGTIKPSAIIFNNKNRILLQRFKVLTENLFGIIPKKHKDGLIIQKASTLLKILNSKFDVITDNIRKSYRIKAPRLLMRTSENCIKRFIRAYLDGDGYVGDEGPEIYSNSKEILMDIKYFLLRFSIISILHCREIQNENRYKLTISGKSNVLKFKRNIGSLIWDFRVSRNSNTNIDVLPIDKKSVQLILKVMNIKYTDILTENEIGYVFEEGSASRNKINRIYSKIVTLVKAKLKSLLETYNHLIVSKMQIKNLDSIQNIFESILSNLKPIYIRKLLEEKTGIRYDMLLEYSRKAHEPNFINILKIIKGLYLIKDNDELKKIYENIIFLLELRKVLLRAINLMGISYNEIAEYLEDNTGNINYYLNGNGLTLQSLDKLIKIIEFVEGNIEARIFDEVLIEKLEFIDFLSGAKIFWDKVVEIKEESVKEVYDLTIKDSHNFLGGCGLLVLHNTTSALAIAHELYGKEWRSNVLEKNASDERGIDVIRGAVKDFARTKSLSDVVYRMIILDECDALTPEAQQALRRTMENFTNVSRFCLVCNYSSKIIEPIQSRCAVFRFKALNESDIKKYIERIVEGEKLKITDDAINTIIYLSEGDLRKVANLLQSSAVLKEKITEDIVYDVASRAKPTDVKEMLELALKGKFMDARKKLQDLLLRQGLGGTDIIAEIHRQIYSLDIAEETKVQLIEKCGEYEYRLSEGGSDLIQLESLLAQFLLFSKSK